MKKQLKSFGAMVLCAALGASLDSRAVYVNPEGTGQALIYPYYTAQSSEANPFNTYLSIVNHGLSAKALRVRLREARNGREVAGFNLLLGPRDTWTGAVVPFGDGARLITRDGSCTAPGFVIEFAPGSPPFMDLSSNGFSGANADGFGEGSERTREGYVEVLEMASLSPAPATASSCDDFRAGRLASSMTAPTGALSGTLTLINVLSGMDFTLNADALADLASRPYYRPASDPYPDFDAAEIDRVGVFINAGRLFRTASATGLEAVEAALTRSALHNEVVMDAATRSATDWVVTFPTKRFHGGIPLTPPFGSSISGTRDIGFMLRFAPRDGGGILVSRECEFICAPGLYTADLRLRWAASVLSFHPSQAATAGAGTSGALGSRNGWIVNLPTSGENGLASIYLSGVQYLNWPSITRLDNGVVSSETVLLSGLPAVGFMVRTLRNGTLDCDGTKCQGNYGGAFAHKYERSTLF